MMTADDTAFGTIDDLPDSAVIEGRRPRVVVLVVALLVAAALAVVVVVFAAGTVAHVITVGGDATPSLETVESGSGIDLPDGTVVVAAAQTDTAFSAEVTLPGDALPDFARYGYAPFDLPSPELAEALGSEDVLRYYAAVGDTVTASAALVERDGATVLFVDVRQVE